MENVEKSYLLTLLSSFCGISYFFSWSLSFYPQTILNWKTKDVSGLSLDFVFLNMLGFFCYTVYNCSLFFDPFIKRQYIEQYGPPVPVDWADVLFAVHAAVLTLINVVQCLIYQKRPGQSVSLVTIIMIGGSILFLLVSIILAFFEVISWLQLIYFFSYIKLMVTLTKYIPQAYTNCSRKSTEGWHVMNPILDLVGGLFSFLQMFVDAANSGSWSVFRNYTKVGLSVFSIAFDILFLSQHYICYRPGRKSENRLPEERSVASVVVLTAQTSTSTSTSTNTSTNTSNKSIVEF